MRRKISCWLYVNFLILLLPVCRAVLVNRTIDDSFGDPVTGFKPVYLPSTAWTDQTCTGCAVQPDTKSAFEGTWTAATYSPGMNSMNITLEFTGVAVWVFFILSNAKEHGCGIVTNTQCNFTLDGQHTGSFIHLPDASTSEVQYNVTSFFRSGLVNATHQLVISTNDYPFNTFVSFDYAIYTADVDDPSLKEATLFGTSVPPKSPQWVLLTSRSSSTDNVGVIVGSVLGGLALVIILISFFLIWRLHLSQQKRAKYRQVQNATDPSKGHVTAPHTPWHHTSHSSSERPGTAGSIPRIGALHVDTGSHVQSHSLSPADNDLPSSGLAPVRYQEPSGHPATNNQEKLRVMRQREINDRLQSAQQEMSSLATRQISPSEGSSSAGQEMASLREQVQELRGQIEHLQTQRNSDWALGLTDDQPPAYT